MMIRQPTGPVLTTIHCGRLHSCDDELEYVDRQTFLNRASGRWWGNTILLPQELYHLYTAYSFQSSDEDGFSAGMVYEWLCDDGNEDYLRNLNKGTVGEELIPYIKRWMYEVFQKNKSGCLPLLPQVELGHERTC